MNRLDLIKRVRSLTRDLSNSIFREVDITDYINEGVDRLRQYIPELTGMSYLQLNEDIPALLPTQYHVLLAIYSTARCFGQDERHYQATTFMNEFETKLEELKSRIESGQVTITDADGNAVGNDLEFDYVRDNYFTKRTGGIDVDEGVEGVE